MSDTINDIWHDRRVNIGYETAEELAKHAHPLNWRGHPEGQASATNDALDSLGWIDEIKVNVNTGNVFNGHLRISLALAKDPAMRLPVDYYDLSPDEEALALQVLDATTEMAEPIPDKLAALLARTRVLTADKPGLKAMLESLKQKAGINGNGQNGDGQEPPAPTETEAERLAKEYGVNLNQIWSLGWHKLAVGDCEDLELRDRLFGDNRPRYGMHDPPYGINVVGSAADSGGAKGFGKIGFTGVTPVNYYAPVLGDDKPFNPSHLLEFCPDNILWGSNYYADKLPVKKGWIVWDKKGREDWRDNFSDCELAWSSLPITTRIYRHVWMGMVQEGEREERVHPTQKPTALFEKIMSELFIQDGIIADFYLGSGPTLLACERLNRTCYGFELSINYAATTIKRWMDLTGLTPKRIS